MTDKKTPGWRTSRCCARQTSRRREDSNFHGWLFPEISEAGERHRRAHLVKISLSEVEEVVVCESHPSKKSSVYEYTGTPDSWLPHPPRDGDWRWASIWLGATWRRVTGHPASGKWNTSDVKPDNHLDPPEPTAEIKWAAGGLLGPEILSQTRSFLPRASWLSSTTERASRAACSSPHRSSSVD